MTHEQHPLAEACDCIWCRLGRERDALTAERNSLAGENRRLREAYDLLHEACKGRSYMIQVLSGRLRRDDTVWRAAEIAVVKAEKARTALEPTP